jgi:hypothetical protein
VNKNEEQIIREKLSNREWRLNNLYWIKDKRGRKVKFKFNPFQEKIFKNLWTFILILKSRQLGITTFFSILYLDAVLFENNQTAGIIAHKEKDAKVIFEDKIKFAFENLPPWLKVNLQTTTDSKEELRFKNGSRIFVSVSTRSSTVQYLHVSEFGYICTKFPEKASEIVSGAINSVAMGQMVSIESTAKGRGGKFFEYCEKAISNKKAGMELGPRDFKFFFFPWFDHAEYTLDTHKVIPIELEDYFESLELKTGHKFTEGQKQWYMAQKAINGDDMFSEYPSTPEEAFSVSVEGTYFGKQVSQLIADKRFCNIPHESGIPVDTYWDLGLNDFTVILFVQRIGKEIRIIDCYYNHNEGLDHYAKVMQLKPYVYGTHYLPHDVKVKELSTNVSRYDTLMELGLRSIVVVPKLSIQEGIEAVRRIFGKLWIDEKRCAKFLDWISLYRKDWDDKLGVWKNDPLHDESSHGADVLRYLAVSTTHFDNIDISTDNEPFDKFKTVSMF